MCWTAKLKVPRRRGRGLHIECRDRKRGFPAERRDSNANLDYDWCLRTTSNVGASGPCSVVVRRRSGPHPPLRFHGSVACAALCQGSVDSSAASRDCRNPPLRCSGVNSPLGAFCVQDGCTRMICVAGAPVRWHDSLPCGDSHLCEVMGRGHTTASFVESHPSGARRAGCVNTQHTGASRTLEIQRMKRDPAPCALGSPKEKNITKSRLSATDISALATMKNVAKCDT